MKTPQINFWRITLHVYALFPHSTGLFGSHYTDLPHPQCSRGGRVRNDLSLLFCFVQNEFPHQVQAAMQVRTLVKQITAKTSCFWLVPLILGTIESSREFGRSGSKHHDLVSLKHTFHFPFLKSSSTANLVSISQWFCLPQWEASKLLK